MTTTMIWSFRLSGVAFVFDYSLGQRLARGWTLCIVAVLRWSRGLASELSYAKIEILIPSSSMSLSMGICFLE